MNVQGEGGYLPQQHLLGGQKHPGGRTCPASMGVGSSQN